MFFELLLNQRTATKPAMTILFQFQINAAGLLTRKRWAIGV